MVFVGEPRALSNVSSMAAFAQRAASCCVCGVLSACGARSSLDVTDVALVSGQGQPDADCGLEASTADAETTASSGDVAAPGVNLDAAGESEDAGDTLGRIAAYCQGDGDILFVSGSSGEFIYSGELSITGGQWLVQADADGGAAQRINVSTPESVVVSRSWSVFLSTGTLQGPLMVGVFSGGDPVHGPELDFSIGGNGRGCDSQATVAIMSLVVESGNVVRLLASFDQHCTEDHGTLQGCLQLAGP